MKNTTLNEESSRTQQISIFDFNAEEKRTVVFNKTTFQFKPQEIPGTQ
jgi:hypothetical protein